MPVQEVKRERQFPTEEEIRQMHAKLEQNQQQDEAFADTLDKFLKSSEKSTDFLFVGSTSNALAISGANQELEVVISPKTVAKCMAESDERYHGHGLSQSIMEQLPHELRNPVMVFKGSAENSLVAITELKDKEQREIMIAVSLNDNGKRHEINRISSAYGRNNMTNYLQAQIEKGNLIAANIEKADAMLQSAGLQSPLEETFISFDNSITYTTANVKYPAQKFTEPTQENVKEEEKAMESKTIREESLSTELEDYIHPKTVYTALTPEQLEFYQSKTDVAMPDFCPWGHVEKGTQIGNGIFTVASGWNDGWNDDVLLFSPEVIMIEKSVAEHILSPEALALGDELHCEQNTFVCYDSESIETAVVVCECSEKNLNIDWEKVKIVAESLENSDWDNMIHDWRSQIETALPAYAEKRTQAIQEYADAHFPVVENTADKEMPEHTAEAVPTVTMHDDGSRTEVMTYANGDWEKSEYDAKGNETYYENSHGVWHKSEYHENGGIASIEAHRGDGDWVKEEHDMNGDTVSVESHMPDASWYKSGTMDNMLFRETHEADGSWEKTETIRTNFSESHEANDRWETYQTISRESHEADGSWEKHEYNEKGKETYFENSDGKVRGTPRNAEKQKKVKPKTTHMGYYNSLAPKDRVTRSYDTDQGKAVVTSLKKDRVKYAGVRTSERITVTVARKDEAALAAAEKAVICPKLYQSLPESERFTQGMTETEAKQTIRSLKDLGVEFSAVTIRQTDYPKAALAFPEKKEPEKQKETAPYSVEKLKQKATQINRQERNAPKKEQSQKKNNPSL